MKVFETKRLTLHRLNKGDAPFILELVNGPSFIQNIGDRGVRTVADAGCYISKVIESYDLNGYGLFRVELKDTSESIGICGLVKRDSLPEADVGFAFLPRYWLKGYAVESAQATLAYARDQLGMKRVLGITSPVNTGSIRVLEKIGLKLERLIQLTNDGKESKLFSIEFKSD